MSSREKAERVLREVVWAKEKNSAPDDLVGHEAGAGQFDHGADHVFGPSFAFFREDLVVHASYDAAGGHFPRVPVRGIMTSGEP